MKREKNITGNHASSWKIIAIGICSGLILVLVGYFLYQYGVERGVGQPDSRKGPSPAYVAAATAELQVWRSQLTTIGTVQAIQGVDVTTEVAGKVAEIAFKAGAHVEAGDLLVKLDTSTERAELRALEARFEKARSDEIRARQLVDRGFISEAGLQQTIMEAKNLRALVEQQRTRIRKKTIRAPFAGKLGIRQISTGELISPGTPIVMLQSIAPIFVNFALPEHTFPKVFPEQNVEIKVAAFPERIFKGKISAINPKVAEKTRNFTAQALLPNSDGHLQPGMFADVTIDLGTTRQVIAIPVSAVTFHAYGESVFFVRKSNHPSTQDSKPVMVAKRAFIKTGERRELMIEVVKGVKAGDRVVTAGQIKIDDDFPIIVSDEDVIQKAEPRPTEP